MNTVVLTAEKAVSKVGTAGEQMEMVDKDKPGKEIKMDKKVKEDKQEDKEAADKTESESSSTEETAKEERLKIKKRIHYNKITIKTDVFHWREVRT